MSKDIINKNNILITGAAGFIGYHLSKHLASGKKKVFGIDNINDYYDKNLKKKRIRELKKLYNFHFYKIDLRDKNKLYNFCKLKKIKVIIHLAAQAGVKYSIKNPRTYLENNIVGTFNILEIARDLRCKHLLIASTSSVYGSEKKFPTKEIFNTDKPLSFYAASKKSCEVLAHSFSNIYNLPITIMRFFTVYGDYGRPDMSLFKFTKAIYENSKINLYNNGKHVRDFTHVQDVIKIVSILINKIPKKKIPYEIYNLGGGKPEKLKKFLSIIEEFAKKKALIKNLPLQKGDVFKTHASTTKLYKTIKFRHNVNINDGIKSFVFWFKDYFKK